MQRFPIHTSACRLVLLCLCLLPALAHATHIRAGEITGRRLDPQSFTYEITLSGYADRTSMVMFGSNGTLDFGDGTQRHLTNTGDPSDPNYIPRVAISEDTWFYELKIIHTFPSARSYTVSFTEFYRSPEILNMDNSVNMPFYIETEFSIDPILGINNTPIFKQPPLDKAIVGKTYHHQPGAYDIDGDSLSYHLAISQQSRNTAVSGYRSPERAFPEGDSRNGNSESGTAPRFSINPYTGDIIWDAPGTKGGYTIIFVVKEWRKIGRTYYFLGYVTRDMQIVVEDMGETYYPQLSFPISAAQAAPSAGEALEWTITGTAPTAADSVVLEIWGDFLVRANVTVSNRSVRAKGVATIRLTWTGEENLEQHYQLIARAYYPSMPGLSRNRSLYLYEKTTTNPVEEEPTDPLGIQKPSPAILQVYPNPAKGGNFQLSLPEATGSIVSYRVIDMKGLYLFGETDVIMQEKHAVALPGNQKGIYLLQITCNGKSYRAKVVVQ